VTVVMPPPAPPVIPRPVHPVTPAAPVVSPADPVASVVPSADPVPPVALPPAVPVVQAPVARQSFFPLISWFWPVLVALIPMVLLIALFALHAIRYRHGQKWARTHVKVVGDADPDAGLEVMESCIDRSLPTCVVRLEPHVDSGTQICEETHP